MGSPGFMKGNAMLTCPNCNQTFADQISMLEHQYICYEDEEARVIVCETPAENPRLRVANDNYIPFDDLPAITD